MTESILALCTFLGGIAAIWFFWDKASKNQKLSQSFVKEPSIPLDKRALFAFVNGNQKLLKLTRTVAGKKHCEVENTDSESAWLHEMIEKLKIENTRELNGYVAKYGEDAVKLSDYLQTKSVDSGFVLGIILDIVSIERYGMEGFHKFHDDLEYSSSSRAYSDEIYHSYLQIKQFH